MLTSGAIVDAVVERIEPYGAWIACEGRRGLVKIPEVSWSPIRHPGEVLSVGQRVRVKVLAIADEEFAASIRAAHPELDPWREHQTFGEGSTFVAPVILKTQFGGFVELRPGVQGLLPRGECPEGIRVGDRLRVAVVSIDLEHRRIEVSLVAHTSP